MLLVRKIPKIKFLLSCTSSRQDLWRRRKYYQLEVQLAYLVNFAQLLLRFASHFTFSALQISLTVLWITFFKNKYIFIYFYLVLSLWLVGSEGAYKTLLARGTACILSGLCPIFIMVCSTFYFSALQVVVLHSLESLFTRVHLHLYFLFGLVPLAGRILRGLVKTAS